MSHISKLIYSGGLISTLSFFPNILVRTYVRTYVHFFKLSQLQSIYCTKEAFSFQLATTRKLAELLLHYFLATLQRRLKGPQGGFRKKG